MDIILLIFDGIHCLVKEKAKNKAKSKRDTPKAWPSGRRPPPQLERKEHPVPDDISSPLEDASASVCEPLVNPKQMTLGRSFQRRVYLRRSQKLILNRKWIKH